MPEYTLDEGDRAALNYLRSMIARPVLVTSAYSIPEAISQTVLVNAVAAPITVTLPQASKSTGRQLDVKKIDASGNAVTIAAFGTERIDGQTTQSIPNQYLSLTLKSDGTTWHLL